MNAEDVALAVFLILSALLAWFKPQWLQVIFT